MESLRKRQINPLCSCAPFSKAQHHISQLEINWLKDQEKAQHFNNGFEQGIYTGLALTFRVLLFHYHELRQLKHRLPIFELYFNEFMQKIDKPDIEQKFAEWYYEETTGYEFLRKEVGTMASIERKKQVGEYVDKYIADNGKTIAEVAAAININAKTLKNIRYGTLGKKVIDKVMDYLGAEFTPGQLSVYREAYGVGDNNESRYKKMEDDLLRREAIRVEVKPEVIEKIEAAEPESIEPVPEAPVIPVPEELPALVEEVVANETAAVPSAVDLLNKKISDGKAKISDNLAAIAEKNMAVEKILSEIEALKAHNEKINTAVRILESSVQAVQEADF